MVATHPGSTGMKLETSWLASTAVAASPLTPAELRVLRYLPTHLSFAEIADEVYVSRNTVKTQAIAVYRKLGVGSREQPWTPRARPACSRSDLQR